MLVDNTVPEVELVVVYIELSSEGLSGGGKANTGHMKKKIKNGRLHSKVMEQQYFGVLIVLPPWPKHS